MMNTLEYNTQEVEVFFAPTSLHLSLCKSLLNESFGKICAQDVSKFEAGAYTGEVSADMLRDFNIELVIVGHSERRKLFKESDEDVAEKWAIAVKYGLRPILCVGENLVERDDDNTAEVISKQLEVVKAKCDNWDNFIICYEPIWTYKTGKVATPEQIQESHQLIREWIKMNVSEERSKTIQILYGGSVTEKNCDDIVSMPDVDGFLIGSTSIKKGFRFVVEQVSDYVESQKENN